MFTKYFIISVTGLFLALPAYSQANRVKNDGKIEVVFMQLNDVYEISPLDHGKIGGMARVATVRKELLKYNPRTYTILAGDFLSPSAMGTIVLDTPAKKKIAGLQMVDAMNAAGIDLVTFGNHEFDIKPAELTASINQSDFDWISSNVKYNDSTTVKRFSKTKNNKTTPIPITKILSFKDGDGTTVKIGLFGLTIVTSGPNRYEAYEDYYMAAGNAIKELKGKCDLIVAVTHLEIGMDKILAQRFPEIKLIIGGHEHVNSYTTIGKTIIAKADANAKTAYIHSLLYNTVSKKLSIKSRLLVINNAIEDDSIAKQVVSKWNNTAQNFLINQGFKPCDILDSLSETLDGREISIRTGQTNLGKLIGESMSEALAIPADCSIYNSGSVRIDDVLTGYITQYDIFRVLPFENKIVVKELQGFIIDSLLKNNPKRIYDGSFLQYSGIKKEDTVFSIHGRSLYKDTSWYRVAMSDYLALGYQTGLEFIGKIKPAANLSPQLSIPKNDVRLALMKKFKSKRPSSFKGWPVNNAIIPCY
ncbi:MAG TPA: bifunctional metallophosphatase/5'-nucleotidase [Chitinophagaceae bacterium]|nr:bifunctional metallophosphatase/5'-nucleotidase [Chitinophagaceae bacterium]